MPEKLVTIQGLSELKGISVRRLRTLKAKGILPFYDLGFRTHLFSPSKCEKALARREVKAIGREIKETAENGE
jgi:hypothetical protein